jgi:MFS family permease
VDSNDRTITGLVMVAHGMVHTYELSLPIFVVIWLVEFSVIDLGFTTVEVTTASLGVVVTVGYGLFGLGALPGGILVDRTGSRSLIVGCLVGMGVSFLLLSFAPSVLVIAFALIVWGLAASVYHPAGLSLVTKGVKEQGTGLGYHGVAGNVGIGVGPLVTATILLALDWQTVARILAVPALVAAVYASRASFDPRAAVETGARSGSEGADADSKAESGVDSFAEFVGESKTLFAGQFVLVFFVVMCSGLYYRGFLTFLPELLGELPGFEPIAITALLPEFLHGFLGSDAAMDGTLSPSDYFYSGLLLIGVVGQYAGGKLTDRLPVEYGIAGGFGTLALLALVFLPAASSGLVPLMIVGALLGVFLFAVQPMYQATVAEYTPTGTRGLSYGYTYLGVFGVGSLGGALAGTVLQFATEAALFLMLALFAGTASMIGLYLGRQNA